MLNLFGPVFLRLDQPVEKTGTSSTYMVTVGRAELTSETGDARYILGKCMMALSADNPIGHETAYMDITAVPTVVDESKGTYRYDFTLRGVDIDEVLEIPVTSNPDLVKSHPSGSLVAIGVISPALLKSIRDSLTNALDEVIQATELFSNRARSREAIREQILKDRQDAFEAGRISAQNAYEASITLQQNNFEGQINSDFGNFVANQRQITAIINSSDNTKIDISSGSWLEGGTERAYAGVSGLAVTLDQTSYYELDAGTGNLSTNTSGFTTGAFPIAKVVSSDTQVSTITNYGASFQVQDLPQSVDTSTGPDDAGKLTKLDSNGKLDSTMLPATAGLAKTLGQPVLPPPNATFVNKQALSTTNYVVPSGKTLVITSLLTNSTSSYIYFDGVHLCGGQMSFGGPNNQYGTGMHNCILLQGDGTKAVSANNDQCDFNGFLIDTAELGDIVPVFETITDTSTYTVPAGKILVVTNNYSASYADLMAGDVKLWGGMCNWYGRCIGTPPIVPTGTVIKSSSTTAQNFMGYLLPNNFIF